MLKTASINNKIFHLSLALIIVVVSLGVLVSPPLARTQTSLPGLRTQGRHLYDKFGNKIVLYGINQMIYWVDLDGNPSYPEMAKTGANVVRIQWLKDGTPDQLDSAITGARGNRMIPMIEAHDATGKWGADLQAVVDYWSRPDIVNVIKKHEEYLLLNIANEAGDASISADNFRTTYQAHVSQLRNAGIHVPLIIDGVDWGKNIDIEQSEGPALIQADPDHNLMFSVHMWWPYMWGYTDQRVIDEINQSVAMNLPLIIGEFGNQWEATSQGQIPYKLIIQQAHLNEVGYLPWSWGPGNNPQTFLDMTPDMMYNSLSGWGLEVAVTDTHSIKNIAVRPSWLNTVPPTLTPTPPPSNLISLGKPVTVSSVESGSSHVGANAVDGSMNTRWASSNSDPQWIYVDLGAPTAIANVELAWEAAYATQYQLQVSNDASTWTTVLQEYNGNGGTDSIAVNQTTRYVRMYGTQRVNSAWGYSMWEFRIFSSGGTAVPTSTPTRTSAVTNTPTRTNTPVTAVASNTPTRTPTRTPTGPTPTRTRTRTPTRTPTGPTPTNTIGVPTNTPTRTSAVTNTPTRTTVPPTATPTPTSGGGAPCSPVTSDITAPFTFDGAGTFCWRSTNLGAFVNSWNTNSVTLNGVNITNVYVPASSYPPQQGGYWYVGFNGSFAWSHFEAK